MKALTAWECVCGGLYLGPAEARTVWDRIHTGPGHERKEAALGEEEITNSPERREPAAVRATERDGGLALTASRSMGLASPAAPAAVSGVTARQGVRTPPIERPAVAAAGLRTAAPTNAVRTVADERGTRRRPLLPRF